MGGVFAKALGRLVGKQEMRILMVRDQQPLGNERTPKCSRAHSPRAALFLARNRGHIPRAAPHPEG